MACFLCTLAPPYRSAPHKKTEGPGGGFRGAVPICPAAYLFTTTTCLSTLALGRGTPEGLPEAPRGVQFGVLDAQLRGPTLLRGLVNKVSTVRQSDRQSCRLSSPTPIALRSEVLLGQDRCDYAPRPAPRGRTPTTIRCRPRIVVTSSYVAGHINRIGAR